jgi:tetratricopeptide (TPR) repeat protein
MRFLEQQLSGYERTVFSADLVELSAAAQAATGERIPLAMWDTPAVVNHNSQTNRDFLGLLETLMGHYLLFTKALDARQAHLNGRFSDAIQLYMANRATQPPAAPQSNDAQVAAIHKQAVQLFSFIREDSTYYLGLIKFQQREFAPAASWMGRSYLERYPDGRWVPNALYHLGRCAEAEGDKGKAIEYYTRDRSTPQTPGNLIRARRLGWQPEAPDASAAGATSDSDAPGEDTP